MRIPKISIIIPFYGVEKYISRCIHSIKCQSFSDYECILIDDESPDNSYEIARNIIENDDRFKIVKQKNKGIGGARNTGLLYATGEYVCFLDSDDWWEENFLNVMISEIAKTKCDVVVCAYQEVTEILEKRYIPNNLQCKIYDNYKASIAVMESPTVWNKLYKKTLWKGISFPENIKIGEDLATLYKVVYKAKNIYYIDECLYNYFIRKDSLTRTYSESKVEDRLLIFELIKNDINKNYKNINDIFIYKLYFQHIILPTYLDIISTNETISNKVEKLENFKLKLDRKYFNLKSILQQNFLRLLYKVMLLDFLYGFNVLLIIQKMKRNYEIK